MECLGKPLFCTSCVVKSHKMLPFHRVRQWNGSFFEPSWLVRAGLVIWLGHGGLECPSETGNVQPEAAHGEDALGMEIELDMEENKIHPLGDSRRKESRLTVVDTTGVHMARVHWCNCGNSPPEDIQVLQLGLFPASFTEVRTVFTFRVLDDFNLDNLESKTPAMNYYNKIRRVTSPACPDGVPVSCFNKALPRWL
jgi:hypothetical protein